MGDNTTHAELSPSRRHRWAACPGSVREEARYPEPPPGAAALDGTRTHAILEYCVKSNLIGPLHLIGTTFSYEHEGVTDSFLVDADRARRVESAIEYIRSRPGAENAIAETRVYPDGFVGRADMSGTIDVQIPGDPYEIIDYKDGMSPVTAKDNPQLEMYAIGVLAGLEKHPKTIRMTITQPKLALKGMPPIVSHDVPVAELLAKVPGIIAEAAATDDPNAPLVPGESQCKYCRAKGACPALAGKAMQEVGVLFQAIPEVLPADIAQQAADKNPGAMSVQELRQILEAAPLVRQLLEGVEEEVKRRLEAGQEVPGFKLVNGRGSRKWALPEEEMVKKLQGMGIPKSAVYVTTLVSPSQAEKLTWDKKGEPCKLSERQIKTMNAEYVSTVVGKPSVAPESDSRPAVVLNAAPLFGDITKEVFNIEVPAFLAPQTVPTPAEVIARTQEIAALPSFLTVPDFLKVK